jgi:hypothetical protein
LAFGQGVVMTGTQGENRSFFNGVDPTEFISSTSTADTFEAEPFTGKVARNENSPPVVLCAKYWVKFAVAS